eukprot:scaffold834_cov123-Cylindrotheca_fusiformis.AAC.44
MSVPSHYMPRHASSEAPKEDCRDYLRTGRCKYGASCKYNHPPNVQSGGGMKGPVDPSEPMFPVRPNEPVCQYYMKHGTCKFGQACKFNHPPSPNLPSAGRMNGTQMMNGGGPKTEMLWNPGNESVVPMLPQRPEEPNCIYFLKNGRCKYGSTCRYHHPLNYHERKSSEDGRRQQHRLQATGDVQPKLHYVSFPPGTYQQGHFVVADGQLAFVSVDGPSQGQVISVAPQSGNQDGPMVFTSSKPSPLSRDVGSSTSSTSIASSYESSNIGSGGSLNTFTNNTTTNTMLEQQSPHSRSSMVTPRMMNGGEASLPRVVSTSSASDGSTVYFDGRRVSSPGQAGPGGPWKGQRSSSFDHTRSNPSPSEHGIHESASVPSFDTSQEEYGRGYHPQFERRGRPPQGPRRKARQNGEVDDGLSMMTSALLTMLDTPEEAAAEYYQDYGSQSSTPLMGNQYPRTARAPHNTSYSNNINNNIQVGKAQYMPQPGNYYGHEQDHSIGMPFHQFDSSFSTHSQGSIDNDRAQRWSPPTWQGAEQQRDLQQQTQSPQRSHSASNVGLYLP